MLDLEVRSVCHGVVVDGRDANILVVVDVLEHCRDICAHDNEDFEAPDMETATEGDIREE
jgi:hypothetical protein